jgi:multidrug efflux pump subunit AcrA (membrane-fusion protein)
MSVPTFRPVAILMLLTLAACGAGRVDEEAKGPLVRTALVGGAQAAPIRYTGVIRSRTESDLGFRVSGKIVQRLVDPGQQVRRGQPLMRLDVVDLQLAASEPNWVRIESVRAAEQRSVPDIAADIFARVTSAK